MTRFGGIFWLQVQSLQSGFKVTVQGVTCFLVQGLKRFRIGELGARLRV